MLMDKTETASLGGNTKYIFVVGGVMSGVGKGVTSSSIAMLLQARGLKVTTIKIDPYINVDAGTMNPTEHGEVFVLKEGLETDQDMGNYERFLNQDLPAINYMTTGSVYLSVIEKERNLKYKGRNVEVVPDIPLEVISRIKKAGQVAEADVVMVEIGGTVGEYQNILFLEAVRMMKTERPADVATIMVSFLPLPHSIGEMKTKPTQTAVRMLNGAGVFADMIIARSSLAIDEKRKEKIATFCNVRREYVISAPDASSIYEVSLKFEADKITDKILTILNLPITGKSNLTKWKKFVANLKAENKPVVKIALVGKYFKSGEFVLSDVYLSVIEALKYSAYALGLQPEITYLSASEFADGTRPLAELGNFAGVLVPGGFGESGVEGKLEVIEYVRKNKIPYFGICYGMQLAVLEYAKNVLKLADVNTTEIKPDAQNPVVDVMLSQKEVIKKGQMGGTMRLGEYQTVLKSGTLAAQAYKSKMVAERHRHRYEVNNKYVADLEQAGLIFSGVSPDGLLMEIMELPATVHPFFVGVQFHPEFKARPLAPHPLFTAFVRTAYEN